MGDIRHGKCCTIRLQGGAFVVTFRHPLLKKVVRKSLKTDQKGVADKYKNSLDELIATPADWANPPSRYLALVRQIWKNKRFNFVSNFGKKSEVSVPSEGLPGLDAADLDKAEFWENSSDPNAPLVAALLIQCNSLSKEVERLRENEAKMLATIEEQTQTAHKLEQEKAELTRERNHWKGRKLSRKECGTLDQEKTKYLAYFKQRKLDPEYIKDVVIAVDKFVRQFGPTMNVADVDEHKVSEWLQLYRSPKGTPISERRRKFLRTVVLKFLSTITNRSFDREAVAKVTSHSIRREQKEIIWLERLDAERLVKTMYALNGDYWGDLARIQLDQGWRPEELIMLRTDLASDRTITLDVVEGEAPKTGKRSIQVPISARVAVRRRMTAGTAVLFPRVGLTEKARKPKLPRSGPLHREMWYPRSFDKVYLSLLREASTSSGISATIDCRTLRRTFGSLQLRGGKKEHEVAALMGDLVDTVRRHYARILAEEVSTELAAMLEEPVPRCEASTVTAS